MEMVTAERVVATDAALKVIERLLLRYGPLMFHLSGGCCEGAEPMCYPLGELKVGESDVRLGQIGGCPVFMSRSQYEHMPHVMWVFDIAEGMGNSYSLESMLNVHFVSHTRPLSDEEWSTFLPVRAGQDYLVPQCNSESQRSSDT
ncbi:DUF779 domain-containing protein [Aquabacterium sp.]|uniref:DUF779 domain-containing protein n=1 Tax=Aquabacterium sp. TaxID=1872578 RepID=UPI0035B2F8AD